MTSTRQAQVPGGAYVNETRTDEALIPGQQYINETSSSSPPPPVTYLVGYISDWFGL